MRKIISLFKRDYEGTRLVYGEVVEGAEWVQAGEGVATRKFDGTCCMLRDGKLFKRYTVKKKRQPPATFEPVTELDPVTGKQEGWVPVGAGAEDQHHRKALEYSEGQLPDGTYELCGPKIQGNPEDLAVCRLIPHGKDRLAAVDRPPRTFAELKEWFRGKDIEGIVWWRDLENPDCDKVKIKKKDFGLKRED